MLVRNDTRVMAARIAGVKEGGTAQCEILLLRPEDERETRWEALVRPGRRLPEGTGVRLPDGAGMPDGGDHGKSANEALRYEQSTVSDALLAAAAGFHRRSL